MTDWKAGDWVTFDLGVGQIKEVREDGHATVSDGFMETSGAIADRFRPLTLKGKRIVETFDIYYKRLRDINGEGGFNYPDIHTHFARLALAAIDDEKREIYEQGQQFVAEAREYKPVIQGVQLFRPNIRRSAQ